MDRHEQSAQKEREAKKSDFHLVFSLQRLILDGHEASASFFDYFSLPLPSSEKEHV